MTKRVDQLLNEVVAEMVDKNVDPTLTDEQWFMDDEFRTPLPEAVSEECARVYGRGEVGLSFAQGLAAFLAIDQSRRVLADALWDNEPEPRGYSIMFRHPS